MNISKKLSKSMTMRLKKEFKRLRKERKKCAKLYPDWQDDEYNMLHHKFIWALPNKPDTNPSFSTINKATLVFNRETERYYLYIDCAYLDMTKTQSQEALIAYLREVKDALADYVYSLDEDGKLVFPYLSLSDMAAPFDGKTPLEVYAKLVLLLYGFKEFYN